MLHGSFLCEWWSSREGPCWGAASENTSTRQRKVRRKEVVELLNCIWTFTPMDIACTYPADILMGSSSGHPGSSKGMIGISSCRPAQVACMV